MSTKPEIYNLALSALLLSKEISDITTDQSNEVRILNTHYDIAFESALQEMDLDSLSTPITLELLASLTGDEPWDYVYKYPTNCIYLRRIVSNAITDNKDTHISKRTGIYDSKKSIYTNEVSAIAECIPKDVPLAALSPMATLTVAYRLAYLASPLIVGKGSKNLRDKLNEQYIISREMAKNTDNLENFNYEAEYIRSEFVRARLE